MNKKVLFTTKGLYSSSNVVIAFILCLVLALTISITYSMHSVLFWLFASIFVIPVWQARAMKKSYITLYEDHVVGFTVPQKYFSANVETCEFKLNYVDITHIETQTDLVKIYFIGGSYLVQAKGEVDTVSKMIQERKALFEKQQMS